LANEKQGCRTGRWAFEISQRSLSDVDDTAFVLMALQRVKYPDEKRMEGAIRRGLQLAAEHAESRWRWAHLDRDNDRRFICNITVRRSQRHDRSVTADVTARVMECLGRFGWPAETSGNSASSKIFAGKISVPTVRGSAVGA